MSDDRRKLLTAALGASFQLRVGINSGEVLAGQVVTLLAQRGQRQRPQDLQLVPSFSNLTGALQTHLAVAP